MQKTLFLPLLATAALSACTWVKPTGGGNAVRVAYDGNVSGCRDAGAISVSVTDKVAFYHRPDLKAAEIPADTIKPNNEPRDGSQQFQAYVCGRVTVRQREHAAPLDEAQTHAIKDR